MLTILIQCLTSGGAELDQYAAPVVRIRSPHDEVVRLQVAERLGHRLRADPLGDRQVAGAPWPLAVQAAKHGSVGEREAMFGPQSANQLTEHDAQIAGHEGGIGCLWHDA